MPLVYLPVLSIFPGSSLFNSCICLFIPVAPRITCYTYFDTVLVLSVVFLPIIFFS